MTDRLDALHPVSRPFDRWKLIEADQRAFLTFGLRIANDAYTRLWAEAERSVFEDGRDTADVFQDIANGLLHADYEWMHLALASIHRSGPTPHPGDRWIEA